MEMKRSPKFKGLKEEREFWDTHSVADYLDKLKETDEIVFERPPHRKTLRIKLDYTTVNKLKKLARAKGVDVSPLIREWIKLHLDKEFKTAM